MPRYQDSQRHKAQNQQQQWEMAPGSQFRGYLRHSSEDKQTIDSQKQSKE